MDVSLKIFVLLFLLKAIKGQLETDYMTEVDENTRVFIREENVAMKKHLKEELNKFFLELKRTSSEILSKLETLNERITQTERSQESRLAEMSLASKEHLGNISRNLTESFNEGLAQTDLKTKSVLQSLSESFTQKLSTTELRIKKSLGGRFVRTESNGTGSELLTSCGTFQGDQQGLPLMTTPSTTFSTVESRTEVIPQPSMPTEVEEVNERIGTIQFAGEADSSFRRKIWVLQSEGGIYHHRMSFALEENGLGANARLSVWASSGEQRVWNGSQNDWMEEWRGLANVFLVTLVISPSAAKTPSFRLKFNTTSTFDLYKCSSEVNRREGRQVISFPPNNTEDYAPYSVFVAVIAPPSGRAFQLTLKFLDAPGTPPDSCHPNFFFVYLFEESPTGFQYRELNSSVVRKCGSVGDISEQLGSSTLAIIRFTNLQGESVGRGFRVEIN